MSVFVLFCRISSPLSENQYHGNIFQIKDGILPLRQSEKLILSIVGVIRSDIRPMAYCLDVIVDLLFVRNLSKGDIRITKDVYPVVANMLNKSTSAVSRSVQRLVNMCWDAANRQNRMMDLFGRNLCDIPSTGDILFYLAFLLYYHVPLFSMLNDLSDLDT